VGGGRLVRVWRVFGIDAACLALPYWAGQWWFIGEGGPLTPDPSPPFHGGEGRISGRRATGAGVAGFWHRCRLFGHCRTGPASGGLLGRVASSPPTHLTRFTGARGGLVGGGRLVRVWRVFGIDVACLGIAVPGRPVVVCWGVWPPHARLISPVLRGRGEE